MLRYALSRLVMLLPTLLIVSGVVFVLIRAIPGDPALLLIGDSRDPAVLASARGALGLDRPFIVQYLLWLRSVATLNLGQSIATGQPVVALIAERFAVTFQVVMVAMAAALAIAVPGGLIAAWRQGRALDRGLLFLSILFLSVPSFWVGLLLILLFGVELRWLPTVGYDGIVYAILPAAALALAQAGTLLRMMRAASIDVLSSDYVTHAYAKGLGDAAVLYRHVLRNAFAPTLSLTGWLLGVLLAGAAVIETTFTIPGLGRLLVDAIAGRDYPVVQGVALFVGGLYVLINLLVDLLYPIFDPRVRL